MFLFLLKQSDANTQRYVLEPRGRTYIFCPYDTGNENNPKYFSKGDYGTRKILIKTTDKLCKERTQKGKYYLCDDTKNRILHEAIHELTLNDGRHIGVK